MRGAKEYEGDNVRLMPKSSQWQPVAEVARWKLGLNLVVAKTLEAS